MSENLQQCQHEKDADFICGVLISELSNAKTLQGKVNIANAILDVRRYVRPMIKEWEHLSGCRPTTDVPDTTPTQKHNKLNP